MASVSYNGAKERAVSGTLDLSSGADIRCMLLIGTSTTPDNPDHEFISDIVADEATDGSYARVALAAEAVSRDDANDRAEFAHSNIVFSDLAGSQILFAILYKEGASDAVRELVSCHDIANTTPNGNDFTLTVGADGSVHVT